MSFRASSMKQVIPKSTCVVEFRRAEGWSLFRFCIRNPVNGGRGLYALRGNCYSRYTPVRFVRFTRSWLVEPSSRSGSEVGAAEQFLKAWVGAQGVEARVDEDEGKRGAGFDSFFQHGDGVVMITQGRIYAGHTKYVMVHRAIQVTVRRRS